MIRLYAHFSILFLTTAYYATPPPPKKKKSMCIDIDRYSFCRSTCGWGSIWMVHLLGKINEKYKKSIDRINQVKFSVIIMFHLFQIILQTIKHPLIETISTCQLAIQNESKFLPVSLLRPNGVAVKRSPHKVVRV